MENNAVSRPRIVPETERQIQHGIAKFLPQTAPTTTNLRTMSSPSGRPRSLGEAERRVQQNIGKTPPRVGREHTRTRELGVPVRPASPAIRAIHQREKRFPSGTSFDAATPTRTESAGHEPEMIKKVAWAALLVSLVAFILFGLYSFHKFSPEFTLQELEKKQQQITTELHTLKRTVHLERLKNALLTARTQLLVQHDYPAAEAQLIAAQQEITTLLGISPSEKKGELQQAQSELEQLRQDIQRGPIAFDEKLQKIASKLEQM